MTRLRLAALPILAAALLFAGCASTAGSAPEADSPADLVGAWGQEGEHPRMEIAESGEVSGYDGCNGFGGTGSFDGGTFVLPTDMMQTMKFCENGDLLPTLPATAELEGGELVLFDKAGDEIGRLAPIE